MALASALGKTHHPNFHAKRAISTIHSIAHSEPQQSSRQPDGDGEAKLIRYVNCNPLYRIFRHPWPCPSSCGVVERKQSLMSLSSRRLHQTQPWGTVHSHFHSLSSKIIPDKLSVSLVTRVTSAAPPVQSAHTIARRGMHNPIAPAVHQILM